MKIAGIILLVLQVISLIPAIITGDNIFQNGLANLVGRFIFGIIGGILLVIAYRKSHAKHN